jgi:hypothetical protein
VTRSKTQQAAQPAPVAPEDPLADLREPSDARYPDGVDDQAPEASEEAPGLVALVTQERWDEAVAEVIAAWHADPTSLGFLHKNNGTMCGCRYLARIALTSAMPVQPELEPEPEQAPADDEDQNGAE